MAGIVGYGSWVPFKRIQVEEIHQVWRNTSLNRIRKVLGLHEKAVLDPSEDTTTLAVGAADRALEHAGIDKAQIGAAFLGTCTNPYDSKPSVTILEDALGLNSGIMAGDIQFAGKSGTTSLQVCLGLVDSGMAKYALAVGSDTIGRHTCPGRLYEYAASSAAAAFVVGKADAIADIKGTASECSDLSDFFRTEGERYIQDIGDGGKLYPAFEAGFANHVTKACRRVMDMVGLTPADYDYVVFQQPYPAIPFVLGKRLGFTDEQIRPGVVSAQVGDCGSASALLGLANVLDTAKARQRILVASYGFGAGSDAFSLETTDLVERKRPSVTVARILSNKQLVDYASASRLEYKYAQDLSPLHI